MAASAQGIDVSSFQGDLTTADLHGLSFAHCKASEGVTGTDPHFAANWRAIKSAGLVRGAYHEFRPADSVTTQVLHFADTVRAQGREPGDMHAVVASDYPGVTTAMIRSFCTQLAAIIGPHCPVLVYTDLSVAKTLTTCTAYPLWIAWPSPSAPTSVRPWGSWKFWQWGSPGNVDRDAFNGTAADLKAWIATYLPAAAKPSQPAPAPTPAPAPSEEDGMPAGVIEVSENVRESHTWPAGTVKQIVLWSDWEGLQTSAPIVDLRVGHTGSTTWDAGSVAFVGNSATYTIANTADCNGCSFTRHDSGPATVAWHTN
jgi:lysozyme